MFASFRKLLVIAPLFLFAAVGFAQSRIEGNVIGTDGKPLEGGILKLDRPEIKQGVNSVQSVSVKTDKKGHFVYPNVPPGVYDLTLTADGKEMAKMTGIRVQPGDNPPLKLDLERAASASAAAALAAAAANGGQAKGGPTKEQLAEQQAEYEKKVKEREEAIAKANAVNDAFNAGMEAEKVKNYPVAIGNFEKAVELAPTQHVIWAQLGESYISLGDSKSGEERQEDVDKGIAAYAKAIGIKADDPNYHNNYALALAKGKKMDQAQAELAKAAELDPPQAGKYFYNLGAVYVNTQQNDAAEAAFKKATQMDPNYADAYYQEGLVLMNKVTLDKEGKMQAPPGTVEAFQKYLALKPDGANADAAKAILEQLGSTVATSFERPSDAKQPAKSNQKKSK